MQKIRIDDPKIIKEMTGNPENVEYLVIVDSIIYAKYFDNPNLMKIAQSSNMLSPSIIKSWKLDTNILKITLS